MPRFLTCCESHSTLWNSKFLKEEELVLLGAASVVKRREKNGRFSLEMFMLMELSVS